MEEAQPQAVAAVELIPLAEEVAEEMPRQNLWERVEQELEAGARLRQSERVERPLPLPGRVAWVVEVG